MANRVRAAVARALAPVVTPMLAPLLAPLLAAVLAGGMVLSGCARGGLSSSEDRAALDQVCGAASGTAPQGRAAADHPDPRPRLTDNSAHISYLQAGDPWQPWTRAISPGHLGALFDTGYYLVTQAATPTGEYYASVLSGRVYPGQQSHPDLQCVAEQVADDLRSSAYPAPNQRTDLANRPVTPDGRPGHLVRFRLTYDIPGYKAHSETVTILVIDTGRADLTLLYASVPDTARGYEPLVDQVVRSVRVL
jgi:hypothetical protein